MSDLSAISLKPSVVKNYDNDRAPAFEGALPKVANGESIFKPREGKPLVQGLGGEAAKLERSDAESPCYKFKGESVNCLDING